MPTTKNKVAIVGVGYTHLTRVPEKSEIEYGVEACRMAAEDAGLDPSEIDGICIQVHHYPPPETEAIARGLGMKQINWSKEGGPLGIGSVGMAGEVLDRGEAKAIVVAKIMNTIAPVNTPSIDPESGAVGGPTQFEVPYGLGYTMQRMALVMRRYMHRYSITEEQMAWVPIVEREYAMQHPYAWQKKPLTMEDYLASRYISDPLRILDCDVPINGAYAYLITREDLAKTLRHPPVYLIGWDDASGKGNTHESISFHLNAEPGDGMGEIAKTVYRDTGLGPKDIDLAYMYDGFSVFVPLWLETMGIVGPGEGPAFIEGGDRVRATGELPLNTHGGNLSNGRMHGQGHVLEAVEQLRGTAGARQVPKQANYAALSAAFTHGGWAGILGRGF